MIKALLLIFLPQHTWEQIAAIQQRVSVVLLTYLLPLLLISTLAECYGLVHWGKPRGAAAQVMPFPVSHAVIYGIGRILISIVVVFIVTKMIKALGETFHTRHSIHQVFIVAAYGMSPLFLMRVFNIFPAVSPWATWAVGTILCITVLYYGIPVILKPDPPQAFGLYLMSCLLMVFVTGLTCFLTTWYLRGRFTKLDDFVERIAAYLPF